ncbi:TIGR03084 family metal-binding protein [Luteipulveratus mongoliensis]|uniref:Wyosine base formation domain-containing protein n=1 Tax=Luteipulveratus mongoliensis TaxID=571913 RepID=A0A0K1JFB1_9MICO|nr:TIGR03084 family metal-binding protein [Luteipulveratus mongoliensis]AKU15391.1 wyosine base formation domain-containing protein [Luteipulveratus mongoliensis]
MADVVALLADLHDESEDLERLVAPLDAAAWQQPTPAPGWTIAHQIAHLAWTDQSALLAATDPDEFSGPYLRDQIAAYEAGRQPVDEGAAQGAGTPPSALLGRWRTGRKQLADALGAAAGAGTKLPWFGPEMSPASMITARLMETWAHGQDVADALDVTRTPTARLRNVAHIGVRTRDFAFHTRQQVPPAEEFRVELTAPDGETWTWGPPDAGERVAGPALDFCLLVTQRRHPDDLAVVAEGVAAQSWLDIAQAFAGAPGQGRRPGQFA